VPLVQYHVKVKMCTVYYTTVYIVVVVYGRPME